MLSRFSIAVLRGQWISILIAGTGFELSLTVCSNVRINVEITTIYRNICNYTVGYKSIFELSNVYELLQLFAVVNLYFQATKRY
jgi:hypothetical protein